MQKFSLALAGLCLAAALSVPAQASVVVTDVNTDPAGTSFSNTVDVISLTAGGVNYGNLLGVDDAALPSSTGNDFFWGASGAAVEPTTPEGAIGGRDLSTGILNPGSTGQGPVNVTFDRVITDENGAGANIFVFNPDPGADHGADGAGRGGAGRRAAAARVTVPECLDIPTPPHRRGFSCAGRGARWRDRSGT